MSSLDDAMNILSAPSDAPSAAAPMPTGSPLDNAMAVLSAPPSASKPAPAPAAAPASDDSSYTGFLLPLKRVPDGQGWFGSHLKPAVPRAVSGLASDFADTAEQSMAAAQTGDINKMAQVAPRAIPYMLGAAPVSEATGAVGKLFPGAEDVTSRSLRDESQEFYQTVDNSGIRVAPQSFQDFATALPDKLPSFDEDVPILTPKSAAVVKNFQTVGAKPVGPTFGKLNRLDQSITKAASSTTDAHDALVLGNIQDNLEEYMHNMGDADLDTGNVTDLDAALSAQTNAKSLWAQNARLRRFEDIQDIAKSQNNPDYYIRNRYTAITRKPAIMAQYTQPQQDLIGQIARDGTLGTIGKAAPSLSAAGLLKTGVLAGLSALPGVGAAVPVGVAGIASAAKLAAPMIRQSRVANLMKSVGSKSPADIAAARAQQTGLMGGPLPFNNVGLMRGSNVE